MTLRRGAGGGAIFVLGRGAWSSAPHQLVAGAAAGHALPLTSPVQGSSVRDNDPPRALASPPVIEIYVLAAPTTTAVVTSRAPAAAPSGRRVQTAVRSGPARSAGPGSGGANGFTYGYCTWGGGHKRHVTRRGDAAQWGWDARGLRLRARTL